MASPIHNHSFGVNNLHGTHHAKHAPIAPKEANESESHQPTDSTAAFSTSFAEIAPSGQQKEASEAAPQKSTVEPGITRASFSNSPLKMGELGEVAGIDLNGPDRLGEARIDGLNGIYSTKLVGLSGQTWANLNPFGN